MTEDAITADLFQSLDDLKRDHEQLLQRYYAEEIGGAAQGEVANFLARARATGAKLDARADRRAAQSIVDFWATRLYRAGDEPPQVRLVAFDPDLAPDLPDKPEPYVGLGPFAEEESRFFFGRDELIQEIVAHLRRSPVVAIVGDSGSGKSSLARAGLIPALHAGALPGSADWRYLPALVPGPLPLDNLARVLTPPASQRPAAVAADYAARLASDPASINELAGELGPAVLLVDQFEETFTLCHDAAHRQAFITALLHFAYYRTAPRRLILTMRADFVDSVAQVDVLRRLFSKNRKNIEAMGHDELRQAILGPATQVGLRFGDRVVEDLVKKHVGAIATLPLLQFTLRRLWRHRQRNRVSWERYQALGGASNALEVAADAFYESLTREEQQTLRRILLRMGRPSQKLETTSSRMPRAEIVGMGEEPARVTRVLEGAIGEGLIYQTVDAATGERYVEVAHEALLRNWPTLTRWIEEDRELNRRRYTLEDAARSWALAARRGDLLWSGKRLSEGLTIPDMRGTLSRTARDFLRAGLLAQQEVEEKERRRLEQEVRAAEAAREAERLRLQLEAEQERAEAEQLRQQLEAERLRQQLESERQRAKAERLQRNMRLLGAAALLATLVGLGALAFLAQIVEARNQADSARVVAERAAATAVAEQQLAATQSKRAADERQLAVARLQSAEVVRATATVTRRELDTAQTQVAALAATVTLQQEVDVGATATSASISQGTRVEQILRRASIAIADGDHALGLRLAVYAAEFDQGPQVENLLQEGVQATITPIIPGLGSIASATWDRFGQSILVLADIYMQVFDADSGRPLLNNPIPHNNIVAAGAWASGSEQIVTIDTEGTVRIWNLTAYLATPLGGTAAAPTSTGRVRAIPVNYLPSPGEGVAWSPDDRRLLAASGDTLSVWTPPIGDAPLDPTPTSPEDQRASGVAQADVDRSAWSPDGRFFVAAGLNTAVRRADSPDLAIVGLTLGQARSAAWSPAGNYIVTGGDDRVVRVWQVGSDGVSGPPQEFPGHEGPITAVSWSPSGRSIVSSSEDGTARIWIVQNPELRYVLHGHRGSVISAAWSPDSRRIVTAGVDGTVRRYFVQFGDILAQAQQLAGQPLSDSEVDALLRSP